MSLSQPTPGRRQFLTTVGSLAVAGLSIPVLAACGGGGADIASGSFPSVNAETMSAIAAAVQKGEPAVGEAKFFPDAHIVLTQPTEGSFVALSSTCTHEGVTINRFSDGQLVCPAHGSRFDPATGEATRGPAQAALPKRTVSKTGNTVTLS